MGINDKISEEDKKMMDEWLTKNKVTVGKTKPMPHELGISNITWNNKLTKAEKKVKDGN
jgi:hypothetical protein|tara:strand:- start:521 stop:697 length:177 start_codon:yes stop_codon:yes gene_type:complete